MFYSRDGSEHDVRLFEGGPLIFKLQNNWSGEGRRVSRFTSGHFIVIAPREWERMGHVPVEPAGCADPAFQAHYFHCDATTASDNDARYFREWNDVLTTMGIELKGKCIFDDSDDGILFVGDPPDLKPPQHTEWVRVGEESERGWGQSFQPDRQSLSEVLGGREGRFFVRVYGPEMRMLDSVAFRYVRDLKRIEVNGAEYGRNTVLLPTKTGYPPIEMCLIGADISIPTPTPLRAQQVINPSGAIEIPPHPDADLISCNVGSVACVDVILKLPRIWWRLEDGRPDSDNWRDTPLVMTRKEFRNHAYAGAKLSVLSKREAKVRAGFDDRPDQPYSRKIEDDHIAIPLVHFADHAQIDRRLNQDTCFNVEWAHEIVSLIVISADPKPEIVSFTAEPATIGVGEQTILEWVTRNADDACIIIKPDASVIEVDGRCSVRPAETTRYTLFLRVVGVEDVSTTITVSVISPPTPDKRLIPRVMSVRGGWRVGKGFSFRELRDAGLAVPEATDRSIPIDKRRQTAHPNNIRTLRSKRDV